MDEVYWQKLAELHRKATDQPPGIDVPIRGATERIAVGSLGEILDQWSAFPELDRAKHVILLGGGSLTDSTMKALSKARQAANG